MTSTKLDYNQIIDSLYYQIADDPEGFFSLLNVPTYITERLQAYELLKDNLKGLSPDDDYYEKRAAAYETIITDYEEVCRLTAFRTGFLTAVVLGKVSRMD